MNKTLRSIRSFLVMFLILYALLIAAAVTPDLKYSEAENKYLAQFPELSFKNLLYGSFEEKYGDYVSDQFPGRNTWITIKSLAETALLKTENNGVIYGSDGYLFQRFDSYSAADLMDNVQSIENFAQKASAPVTVMIVPSSYTVLSGKVPSDAPFADQRSLLENGAEGELGSAFKNCSFINVLSVLDRHSDEYIYYRTDHHWTTDGAWYAYNVLCTHLGLEAFDTASGSAHQYDGFLGTSYSKCKKARQESDTITYYDVSAVLTEGGKEHDTVYDYTKLSTRDKYAMFLYGNGAERQIDSAQGAGKKRSLLVIKDSFADCLIPFLTHNYESITCIDPRYYSGSFTALAAGEYDDILVIFGFEDLAGESSILKLGF